MRIDNQQQQNKGVMDLMPQTGAVEEKNGIQMFADAVKTESSKKSAGTTSFQAKEVTYLNPAKEEKKTVIDEIEQSGSMDAGERKAQMAVLAETTSPEDYERMQEDGFSLDDTTSNKIVTVTDMILISNSLHRSRAVRNLQFRSQTVCGKRICRLRMIILNRSQRQ